MGDSSGGSWASAELTQRAHWGFLRKVGAEGRRQREKWVDGRGGKVTGGVWAPEWGGQSTGRSVELSLES